MRDISDESKESFRKYLLDHGKSSDTASDYCAYVSRIGHDINESVDEIVSSDKKMLDCLDAFQDKLRVSESSFSSYASGLRAYYQYKNGHRFVAPAVKSIARNIEPEVHWYQEFVVKEVEQWWHFVGKMNETSGKFLIDPRCWAYRGQGNATWGLESSLGRVAKYGDVNDNRNADRLFRYEKESRWTFAREAAKSHEYRCFDGCDLLSLMQHYECKTRLLDFTMAPLVALYMAVEQHEADYARAESYIKNNVKPSQRKAVLRRPDLACWAINLDALMSKIEACGSGKNGFQNNVENVLHEASLLLEDDPAQVSCGVLPVFPKICNQRIVAQDGLFLMPKSLRYSFEDNLRASLGSGEYTSKSLSESDREVVAGVYKFVFPSTLLDSMKRFLRDANVTAKSIYPDLIGLGRFVTQEIQRHEDDNRK